MKRLVRTLILLFVGVVVVASCEMGSSVLEEINTQVLAAKGNSEHELTITSSGNGSASPSGSITIAEKDNLSINATAASGYNFVRWQKYGGAGVITFQNSNSPSTSVNLKNGDAAIEAVFTADNYTLNIESDSNGSTSPSGVVSVSHGVEESINATASTGYTFDSWSVETGSATIADSNDPTTTVTLTGGDATVRANFTALTYNLTIQSGANGSVNPSGVQNNVAHNTPFTIRANPNRFYSFENWTKIGGTGTVSFIDSTDRTTDVTVTGGDVTIQANFVQSTYALEYRSQLHLNVAGQLNSVEDMLVDGNYLYLGGRNGYSEGTVMRIDVTNKNNPSVTHTAGAGASGNVTGIDIGGSYLFAADSGNGIYRFNKSNLGSKISNTNYDVVDVAVHGNNPAFVLGITKYDNRVYAYYTSNLSSGSYVSLPGNGYHLDVNYNYAFVTAANAGGDDGEFHSIDAGNVGDQGGLQLLDTFNSPFNGDHPGNLEVIWGEAAFMTADDSLVSAWVDGPSSISLAENEPMTNSQFDLAYGYFSNSTNYAKYMLVTASKDGSGSYTYLDILDLDDPQVVGSFSTHTVTDPEAITIDGNYLYTVEDGDRIVIYEIVIDP